jgi:hypothetical protein
MMKCIKIQFYFLVAFLLPSITKAQQTGYFQKQWQQMSAGVQVSFANSGTHYHRDRIPQIGIATKAGLQAWKGEKVNTLILIWSSKPIQKVSIEKSNFTAASGKVVSSQQLTTSFVKYVWTDGYFGNGCDKRDNQKLDSSLVGDLLDTSGYSSLEACRVQPVWVSFTVPENAATGLYNGKIIVRADEKEFSLRLSVQVAAQKLPPAKEWDFDLDLWQYPVCIADFHKTKRWSEEHFASMKPYYIMLANAGQKNITVSIIEGGNQDKEVSPAMIKWIKRKDGTWRYDYDLFDKYVSFVMNCGINRRINCYSMLPWTMTFSYYDEAKEKDTSFVTTVTAPEFKSFWQSMLTDFAKHLKQKGWFQKTNIAMDERKLPDMLRALEIIRETDSEWHVALAGSYHPELIKLINDYSIFKASVFTKEELNYRNSHLLASTFYTSCEGERPNMFSFSPPAEATWIGWYAAAKGFSGFLRWGYNLWNSNPLQDSRGRYPGGDAFQIYPGPQSSVRFEKLSEGIQDYMKIQILKKQLTKAGDNKGLKAMHNILSNFENDRLEVESAEKIIAAAKRQIQMLAK